MHALLLGINQEQSLQLQDLVPHSSSATPDTVPFHSFLLVVYSVELDSNLHLLDD
jgi:hypothetical protein